MGQTAQYIYALYSGVREKRSTVDPTPQRTAEFARQLRQCGGITKVTTNPVTGGLLVQYDPQRLSGTNALKVSSILEGYIGGLLASLRRPCV